MRTEIASLGEFGLIRRLTEGIELKMNRAGMVWAMMPPYSPTLPKSKC